MKITLEDQVRQSCRHLLSEVNRDSATPTYGCFDRRYWAWKLVDFPEATFQRNLANLAWYMQNCGEESDPELIKEAVIAGLLYSTRIQHRDGSFDQAFPFERSFGATGFLLPDLIKTYRSVKEYCSEFEKGVIENSLKRSVDFLCRSAERHSLISNHLAGASLGLYKAADFFEASIYKAHAQQLLEIILSNQSPEGWFPEYGGADPGYQTLCMHYLAQIYQLAPSAELRIALDRSLDFLQYFVHPDGSFGGEYGSRRTEVYYPGGIALLSKDFSLASTIHGFMENSIENLTTVTLVDIDMGNMAPLLSSSILALDAQRIKFPEEGLPFEQNEKLMNFQDARIAIINRKRYYAVLGASNGGVLKVFDKQSKSLAYDDCGALVRDKSGRLASSQYTNLTNKMEGADHRIVCDTSFYRVAQSQPNPWNILLLRLMNLTVMRLNWLNEWIKKVLVNILVKPSRQIPLRREREVSFKQNEVIIRDTFNRTSRYHLESLRQGIKFNSIHMASSRYYSPTDLSTRNKENLEIELLNAEGKMIKETTIALN